MVKIENLFKFLISLILVVFLVYCLKIMKMNLIDILEKLNSGSFDIILDDTHKEHKISEYTLKLILQKIQ